MSEAPERTPPRQPLALALLGHGKMGRAIEALAPERGFDVRLVLTSQSNRDGAGINRKSFDGIGVCMDFTSPGAVVENIRRVAGVGCNLVVGTTGWADRLDEVRKVIEGAGVGMVYSANFSVGVELFYRVARAAAEAFAKFPAYDAYLWEAHHKAKKDAPSGTALELRRRVAGALTGREVPISSLRAGSIPGTHELGFDSPADTILVRHTARGRQGFAEGALLAAHWVVGKRGLFTFSEALDSGTGRQ